MSVRQLTIQPTGVPPFHPTQTRAMQVVTPPSPGGRVLPVAPAAEPPKTPPRFQGSGPSHAHEQRVQPLTPPTQPSTPPPPPSPSSLPYAIPNAHRRARPSVELEELDKPGMSYPVFRTAGTTRQEHPGGGGPEDLPTPLPNPSPSPLTPPPRFLAPCPTACALLPASLPGLNKFHLSAEPGFGGSLCTTCNRAFGGKRNSEKGCDAMFCSPDCRTNYMLDLDQNLW